MFTLSVPSSSGATSVISNLPKDVIGSTKALPIGTTALELLGGSISEAAAAKKAGGFPEDKINIPVGVTPQNVAKYNLYEILGFSGEWGASADLEALRKAYHKAVLHYHPDKAQFKTSDGKEDRSVFLKIQEAFNVLSNENKRRAYDSQLPFDESIPTEAKVTTGIAKSPLKFFKYFTPVFQRNARFAVTKPVPDLGDMDTPLEEVYKFYSYWHNFESWRDFTGVGAEHNPDDASSREEKRWMQKENERLAKKHKKKEMERIINLVTLAEKYDPRITAEKDRKRKEKEAKEQEKIDAANRKAEDDAKSKAWAQALEDEFKEKAAAVQKLDKEKLKKAMSNARNILRKLLRFSTSIEGLEMDNKKGEYGIVTDGELEAICAHASLEVLTEITEAMGGMAGSKDVNAVKKEGYALVLQKLASFKDLASQAREDELILREAQKRYAEEASKKKNKNAVPVERVWTPEVIEFVTKAIARYPVGTPNRWEAITNYMNVQAKPEVIFTQDELIKVAYILAHRPEEFKF